MKDYYQVLEVPFDATQESIKQQYRFLVFAWHPDRFPSPAQKAQAQEKLKAINLAYEILGDPGQRVRYDYEQKRSSQSTRSEKREQHGGSQAQAEEHRRAEVRFSERQNNYNQFFSALLADLRKTAPFSVKQTALEGLNYYKLARLPTHGMSVVETSMIFTQSQKFMIELYIDTARKVQNKRIFDALIAQRDAIEMEFGERLTWERLNERLGSRIAVYRDFYITDSKEKLSELKDWAIKALIRLYPIMDVHVSAVLKELAR